MKRCCKELTNEVLGATGTLKVSFAYSARFRLQLSMAAHQESFGEAQDGASSYWPALK